MAVVVSIKLLLNSLNFDQNPTWIKAFTFKARAGIGVSTLVRDDSGSAEHLVIAFMGMAVNPKIGLIFFDDINHVQRIECRL